MGDQLLVLANLVVNPDSRLIGQQVRDLGSGRHAFVLSHARDGQITLFPSAQTVFQAGDRLTLQTEPATLRDIHLLNRDSEPY